MPMNSYNIPIRPDSGDFSAISERDKDTLTFAVLWGVSNEAAFARFNPALVAVGGSLSKAGQQRCNKFFCNPDNVAYLEAYKQTLSGVVTASADSTNEEKRGQNATRKLMRDCITAIETNRNLEPEILRDFVQMFKALGLLKDEAQQKETPRRYLPVRCYSECQYRFFVETAIKDKDVINECDYCRTRKFAEDKGWRYDPTKNLDIPTEILKAVAPNLHEII